jgi:integrase
LLGNDILSTIYAEPGIRVRGDTIEIVSTYLQRQRFEKLNNVAKVNKNSTSYASNKRRVILIEIKGGKFNYLHHFPNSTTAKKLAGLKPVDSKISVCDTTDNWISVDTSLAESTLSGYASKAKHIINSSKSLLLLLKGKTNY